MLELFGQRPVCDTRLYILFPKTMSWFLAFWTASIPEIRRNHRV